MRLAARCAYLTVCWLSVHSLAEACEPSRQGCCLEGVPNLRHGLLCTNGRGLTGAMDWRFPVYLQLGICGLSMARPPSLLICISVFLGDTGDGDTLLSPSPSTGGYTYGVPQLIQRQDQLDSGSNTKARGGSFGLNWQLGCCQGPVV